MGCPDKNVLKQGAGSYLIQDPPLAKQIIKSTKEGAGDLPVSVKTRIGFDKIITRDWMKHLLETEPVAITIHGRTKVEMSAVPAHWDEIAIAAEEIHNSGLGTLAIGNGDVQSITEAKLKAAQFGVDGVMIGRAIFGNVWRFNEEREHNPATAEEKLDALLDFAELYATLFAGKKPWDVCKKHVKAFVNGFPAASNLRVQLMETQNIEDMRVVLKEFKRTREMEAATKGIIIEPTTSGSHNANEPGKQI